MVVFEQQRQQQQPHHLAATGRCWTRKTVKQKKKFHIHIILVAVNFLLLFYAAAVLAVTSRRSGSSNKSAVKFTRGRLIITPPARAVPISSLITSTTTTTKPHVLHDDDTTSAQFSPKNLAPSLAWPPTYSGKKNSIDRSLISKKFPPKSYYEQQRRPPVPERLWIQDAPPSPSSLPPSPPSRRPLRLSPASSVPSSSSSYYHHHRKFNRKPPPPRSSRKVAAAKAAAQLAAKAAAQLAALAEAALLLHEVSTSHDIITTTTTPDNVIFFDTLTTLSPPMAEVDTGGVDYSTAVEPPIGGGNEGGIDVVIAASPTTPPPIDEFFVPEPPIQIDLRGCPSSITLVNCKCLKFFDDSPSVFRNLSTPEQMKPLVIIPEAPPTSWLVKCRSAHVSPMPSPASSVAQGPDFINLLAATAENLQTNPLLHTTSVMPMLPENVFGQRILIPSLTITDSGLYYVKRNAFNEQQARALRELNFSGNTLRELPRSLLAHTINMQNLNMSRNQIVFIQRGELDALKQLKWLDLSQNRIRTIANGSFSKQTNLIMLNLAGNELDDMSPSLWDGLEQLRVLFLAKNPFRTPAAVVFDAKTFPPTLSNVRLLDLSQCNIQHLRASSFKNMPLLEQLNLAGNTVTYMSSDTFEGATNLRILLMQNNRGLHSLPQRVFTHTLLLNVIDFRNGSLEALVADTFTGARNLMVADFRNNSLAFVGKHTFLSVELYSLRELYLGGNKFVCDWRLAWLRDWILSQQRVVKDLSSIQCYEPAHLRGVNVATGGAGLQEAVASSKPRNDVT